METNVQTYISLGYVLVRTEDKWMDDDNLILMSKSEAIGEMLKHLDAKRKRLEEFPSGFADDWKFDEREDWETIDHWYDHMRERAENGLSISLSQDDHLYTKEVYVPYVKSESTSRSIGHIIFVSQGGVVHDDEVVLYRRREKAVTAAMDFVDRKYEGDDDSEMLESARESARKLVSMKLNEKEDLNILTILDPAETADRT